MLRIRRVWAGVLVLALVAAPSSWGPASAQVRSIGADAKLGEQIKLPDGRTALLSRDGAVRIFSKDHRSVETRLLPRAALASGSLDRLMLSAMLAKPAPQAYASGRLIVVYRSGVTSPSDSMVAIPKTFPSYTTDAIVNRMLARLGVDRSDRLFQQVGRSALAALRTGPEFGNGAPPLDLSNAFVLHVTGSSVLHAAEQLATLPQIAYVSPDWSVDDATVPSVRLSRQATLDAQQRARAMATSWHRDRPLGASTLPDNYALTSSLQSMLNAPSDDVAAAYDEIERKYHQVPGQGEIITDVSLGDLDDATDASNPNNACFEYTLAFGPTTEIVGGQRYLNLPSMPLIPTYTASATGSVSPTGEVCGVDPEISAIGLAFSLMAPLPHDQQRSGEQGSGATDLLGIAPGAKFRLVVPASFAPGISDVDAALLAAAMQNPKPNVITTGISFAEDHFGFPQRFLEDDTLTEAIVAAIVQNLHIAVSIAGGDGITTYASTAVGTSGGSTATETAPGGLPATVLTDIAYSTVPSLDYDSGSIDAGGSTLDDIFAQPPQFATGTAQAQHGYAQTRWTGFTTLASAYGSRVNVSAPADNLVTLSHRLGGADDAVTVGLAGSTEASAAQVAAAVAVVEQIARLTGHPFQNPVALRKFLKKTGSALPAIPQADVSPAVGRQIDVRSAVEALYTRAGVRLDPAVARVAVEQRRNVGEFDAAIQTDTNPSAIDLQNGELGSAVLNDRDVYAWITIAPDWEFVAPNATYALKIAGTSKTLAKTPWARLLPATILSAAGLRLVSSSSRTVKLVYAAKSGGKTISQNIALTFGPADATSAAVLAPHVAPVTNGNTISVSYDISTATDVNDPKLFVAEPGRINPDTGGIFHPSYTKRLTAKKGSVSIPINALQGGGIYAIGIAIDSSEFPYSDGAYLTDLQWPHYSDVAITRVVPKSATDARPNAPLLSSGSTVPGHRLVIPYDGSFKVKYDVSAVPGATDAALEVSAAGPTAWNSDNPFNNPNGTIRDHNGVDTGSIYFVTLSGTKGTKQLKAKSVGLFPAMNHVVRIIPMANGKAIGEASDVSTIAMDAVAPSDGGAIYGGWAINANGTDGFLTSNNYTSASQSSIVASLVTFDQRSAIITGTVAASTAKSVYTTLYGGGIFGNDLGLVDTLNTSNGTSSYNLLNPVTSGTLGAPWTPSFPNLQISMSAINQANDTAAFLAHDETASFGDVGARVFTSQIAQNTFSSAYNVSAPINAMGYTFATASALAEDTALNSGLVAGGDFLSCAAPVLVTVDLGSGAVDSIAGVGEGMPYGIAVDSATGIAAMPTYCDAGLGFYNLSTKTGSEVIFPGKFIGEGEGYAEYTAADPTHNLILVEQTIDSTDSFLNNNSLSRVLVYNEHGNLVKSIARFNLYNTTLTLGESNLQVNPTTRKGYLPGPGQLQLVPFSY